MTMTKHLRESVEPELIGKHLEIQRLLSILKPVVDAQAVRSLPSLSDRQFSEILTSDELWNLIRAFDIPAALLDLAQDCTPLPKSTYTTRGELDKRRILELHHNGATIILRAAHRWLPGLRDLCSTAEAFFGTGAQANIYLTPASRQSTPPHWDTHDLLIFQLEGVKNWRLFDSDYPYPLDDQRFDKAVFSLGDLREEQLLKAGDALYLPRGSIHEPQAIEYSSHIALGIHNVRWSELLGNIVREVAEKQANLRAAVALPAHAVFDEDVETIADSLVSLCAEIVDRDAAKRAVLSNVREFQNSRVQPPLLEREPTRRRLSSSNGVYMLRQDRYLIVHSEADRILIDWGDGRMSMPSKYGRFVADLASRVPLDLGEYISDVSEATALAESLVAEGVLVAVVE